MKSRHSPYTGNPSVLHTLQPFSWLSEEQLKCVLPSVQYRTYPAGVPILRAGDPADGLYILLSGRVLVVYEGHDGHELMLSAVGPNDFFGELGLFDSGSCAATVRSQQACEALFLPSALAIQCLQSSAPAAICMLRKVISRLCEAHHKMASLALTDVYERVAKVMLENLDEMGAGSVVSIGAERMASMVGASREMVTRVVRDMIGRGVVRRQKRTLIVLDRKGLHARRRKYGAPQPQPVSPRSADKIDSTPGSSDAVDDGKPPAGHAGVMLVNT